MAVTTFERFDETIERQMRNGDETLSEKRSAPLCRQSGSATGPRRYRIHLRSPRLLEENNRSWDWTSYPKIRQTDELTVQAQVEKK